MVPDASPTSSAHSLAPRARLVHRLAEAEGFAMAGIAPAAATDHAAWARQWIADARYGEMHYLQKHLDVRLDPGKLLPGAQAVIVVADFYEERGLGVEGPRGQASERGSTDAGTNERSHSTPADTSPRAHCALCPRR